MRELYALYFPSRLSKFDCIYYVYIRVESKRPAPSGSNHPLRNLRKETCQLIDSLVLNGQFQRAAFIIPLSLHHPASPPPPVLPIPFAWAKLDNYAFNTARRMHDNLCILGFTLITGRMNPDLRMIKLCYRVCLVKKSTYLGSLSTYISGQAEMCGRYR
jgi:hypothetical protein